MAVSIEGKIFVVTGATAGIGLATAEALVRSGAAVIGMGRSAERCRAAENNLRGLAPGAQVQYLTADLSRQDQVRKAAEEIRALLDGQSRSWLDGLVNNAGTFTYWFTLTPEGFETQWAVNHLAPFLLTCELLPLLQAAPSARVVTVSSDSHQHTRLNWNDIQLRRRYNGLLAYQQTKLANVLFTLELNRRLGLQSNLRAFAADPGLVRTEIGFKGTPGLVRWIWDWRRSGGVDPSVPAQGILYLLSDPAPAESSEIYWKQGRPQRASSYALDQGSASRLWTLSAQMCGLTTSLV